MSFTNQVYPTDPGLATQASLFPSISPDASIAEILEHFPVTELILGSKPIRARVDTESLPKILSVSTRWITRWDKGSRTYYVRTSREVLLHRVITDAPKGMEVDHFDHDGLNNRGSNLRVVTTAVNCANRRWPVGMTGYRNVVPHRGKFRGSLMVNFKRVLFGPFDTPEEARDAVEEYRRNNNLPSSEQTKWAAKGATA